MLDAMDKVRREEQGHEWKQRKMGRKLLMLPEVRMNEQQHEKLVELSKKYPKTGRAFRMVQSLDIMYAGRDWHEGKASFDKLIS
jgi:transposase